VSVGPVVRLGISACLLGNPVRYDGGHKRDRFLTDVLSEHVEWVPVCPEVELGLGTPRDSLRLVGTVASPRLVQERTGNDLTARIRDYAAARVRELERLALDGYVLKRASPSCGLFRVRVYRPDGIPSADGRGLFAAALTAALPALAVEEEGRLSDPMIRDHFIERVYAAARWRAFRASRPRARDLVVFHAAQKFAVLAHSPSHYTRLGRLVAAGGTLEEYGDLLTAGLAVRATRGRHANVLQHLAGYFKRDLDVGERAELVEVVGDYRRGVVPLIVPLTLITHHVRRLRVRYLADQVYLNPHPRELMLRNAV
jgi:uncharacterized protein YbgA (DUF1722 family)/uncharacterized protein YbbK (DUF523 family)